jgi:hypothetical protein
LGRRGVSFRMYAVLHRLVGVAELAAVGWTRSCFLTDASCQTDHLGQVSTNSSHQVSQMQNIQCLR